MAQRFMGLDLGDKTIGVAVSDLMGWTAQGVTTIRRKNMTEDLAALRRLVDQYEVSGLVIGLPRNMDGSYGPRAEGAKAFGARLAEELKLPVAYWDERLSTVAATRTLLEADLSRSKRKQVVDKMAAVYILQGFLDRQKHSPV